MSSEKASEEPEADCQNTVDDVNEESENSNAYVLNASCVEVKLEIELNENETENNEGGDRLQFVNFNSNSAETDRTYGNSGYNEWNQNTLPPNDHASTSFFAPNEPFKPLYDYSQYSAPCDTLSQSFSNKETSSDEPQNSSSTSPVTCEFSADSSTGEAISSQYSETIVLPKKRRWKPTDADKKKNYRNRIKEENPEMWATIKMKERCRKREQREERRLVLFEMQKTQALISECESSLVDTHIAHLQALRERYPDVWVQFAHDLSPVKNNLNNIEDSEALKRSWPTLTEAEKKRYYRKKMKEENPELWSAVKMKDACKKREQREEKRQILLDMQKTQELIAQSDSATAEEHKAHLEDLKERYPDLWMQLEDAIAATKMRSQMMLFDKQNKKSRRVTKPVEMYKDVIEAHKKFLYRQRLKEERPEYYAQMKARDAYAKSLRRMMLKRGICTSSSGFEFSAFAATGGDFGISVGNNEFIISAAESDKFYSSSKNNVQYNISLGSDGFYTSTRKDEFYTTSKNDEYNITNEKDAFTVSAESNRLIING